MQKQANSFLTIIIVALTAILLGGLIGAITNMINGAVSPYYFKAIMGWEFDGIWIASIAQGIFEGLLYGVVFSIIFTTAFGIITKGQAPYKFALQQLIKITVIVFSCWTIGGLIAILLATLSPDFYKSHFLYIPTDRFEKIKYAWVGGSISGGIIGGLISTILGVVIIKNSWTQKNAVAFQ